MEKKVWNKYETGVPRDAVNIMRPTIWGNPFSHMAGTTARYKVATREEAVEKHREWIWSVAGLEVFKALPQLKGKHLVCCCVPKDCHGHELEALANDEGRACAKCDELFNDYRERMEYYGVAICRPCLEEVLSDR